jgi:type IV pilus assembly protein PilO
MSLLPSDQRSQAKIAVGVAALAAAAYYYQYPYAAAAERIAGQEARAERLEAANAKAAREAAKGVSPDALKREAARSRATLEMLRRLVPAEHEVPGLLEQVSTAARRAGLDLAGVAPEPVLAGSAFDTYRYKVKVAGGYHALAAFLGNVGSLPRIVAPVTFQLVPRGSGAASMGGGRAGGDRGLPLDASLTVQTYVAHVAPPAPPARGGHAAAAGTTASAQGGEVAP